MVVPDPEQQPPMSVEEAGRFLGLGRTAAYEAVKRGEIPVLRFNARTLRVPTAELRRMLSLGAPNPAKSDCRSSETDPTGQYIALGPDPWNPLGL